MRTPFNPLEKFDRRLIDAFRKSGERYLVSQTYEQGTDGFWEPGKESLLFTHYADSNQAQLHLQQLAATDRYKALIDLEREKHRETVRNMLRPDSKYVVYSSLIGDPKRVEKRTSHKYKTLLFRFIRTYTSWKLQPHEVLEPRLKLIYGELFVSIERFGEHIQLTLKDLEKLQPCATTFPFSPR